MTPAQEFLLDLEGNQAEILSYLDEMLMSFPEIESKIHYRVPFYYRKSWICYCNPRPNDRLELVFLRGNELSNEQGLLDDKGRKQVMGIEFGSIKEIPGEVLWEVVQEAILLDETVPYASKRKKTRK